MIFIVTIYFRIPGQIPQQHTCNNIAEAVAKRDTYRNRANVHHVTIAVVIDSVQGIK